MIPAMKVDESFAPLNQDGFPMEALVYANTMQWLASYVRRQEAQGVEPDAMVAQIEKDLRMMLDQIGPPQ